MDLIIQDDSSHQLHCRVGIARKQLSWHTINMFFFQFLIQAKKTTMYKPQQHRMVFFPANTI